MNIEQVRKIKDIIQEERDRQCPINDAEYINELEEILFALSYVKTEE